MADATAPADGDDGQEPVAVEGQEPEPSDDATDDVAGDGQEPEPKTYSAEYVKRLRREQAQNRKKVAEVEGRLREFEDRDKSELDKQTDRAAAAEAKAAELELRVTRFEVAAEKGLDLAVAEKFLVGTTREEVEERADELTRLLDEQKAKRNGTGGFDGGARVAPPETKKPEEAHNDFLLGALGRKPT